VCRDLSGVRQPQGWKVYSADILTVTPKPKSISSGSYEENDMALYEFKNKYAELASVRYPAGLKKISD